MTSREQRLRARIDTLTDQRDEALERVDFLAHRLINLTIEQPAAKPAETTHRLQERLRDARRSRDQWRQRARDAEHMLGEIHRQRRRGSVKAAG
jgi:chromosome segregation ATPase